MKAFQFTKFGIQNLELVELPEPKIEKPHEVKVCFKAQSLNFRDYLMITGQYNPKQKLPLIPLSDGAGEVIEVGEGVTKFKKGDRVSPIFVQHWISGAMPSDALKKSLGGPLNGTLCEYAIFSDTGLVMIPKNMNFVEAATLPCAALTAYSALVTHAQLKKNDQVLIIGSGGVSIFSIQIAKALGAHVIVVTSQEKKMEKLYALGADDLIHSKAHPNWHKEVLRLTEKRGVELVVEVGGAGTLEKSIFSTRRGGHISLIGVLAGGVMNMSLLPIVMRHLCLQGILVGSKAQFDLMNSFFEKAQIKPAIQKIFSFEKSVHALEYLKSGNHIGKICIAC